MGTPLQVTLLFSCCFQDSLFIFNLWHFNYDVSWCVLFWVQLVWDSLNFCMSISFTKLGKFSFIIFSNKFSTSCSLFSPSGTPMIQMLVCLKLPERLLSLSVFLMCSEALQYSLSLQSELLSLAQIYSNSVYPNLVVSIIEFLKCLRLIRSLPKCKTSKFHYTCKQ